MTEFDIKSVSVFISLEYKIIMWGTENRRPVRTLDQFWRPLAEVVEQRPCTEALSPLQRPRVWVPASGHLLRWFSKNNICHFPLQRNCRTCSLSLWQQITWNVLNLKLKRKNIYLGHVTLLVHISEEDNVKKDLITYCQTKPDRFNLCESVNYSTVTSWLMILSVSSVCRICLNSSRRSCSRPEWYRTRSWRRSESCTSSLWRWRCLSCVFIHYRTFWWHLQKKMEVLLCMIW